MKTNLAVIFFMITLTFFAQEKHEYMGVIKLNGDSKSIIPYRLVFTEKAGVVSGYSVTDLAGPHETKNMISGTYNAKTKEFVFKEDNIVYTKSPISDDMFCFVNYTGKVKLVNENSVMDGAFKGLFKNKQKCIDGTLTLIGSAKIYKVLGKVNKKLQKSKKYDDKIKQKANPIALLDSLKVNNLTKSQNLNVFTKSTRIILEVWDDGKEDGDMVSIYQGNTPVLLNYEVKNHKKQITLDVKDNTRIRIVALNEGIISPNTVVVKVVDNEHVLEVFSNLKKDEEAYITIVKSNQE